MFMEEWEEWQKTEEFQEEEAIEKYKITKRVIICLSWDSSKIPKLEGKKNSLEKVN